jgi:hypothetical protein
MTILFAVTLDCRDDVPQEVLDWMAANLTEHAEQEFGPRGYRPDFTDEQYPGPPLRGAVVVKSWRVMVPFRES